MAGGERAVSRSPRDWWLDSGLLFILAAALVLPVFRLNYLNNWPSIEATFIADGRMQAENWFHHLWQPLWYCGTRVDYLYPPGLRYGVGLISSLVSTSPAHAYHVLIGVMYALGIVAVYLWTRTATQSRGAAWLAAAAAALVSPCFLLKEIGADSPFRVAWRLHVLMTYGEGPHISSFSVLPVVWLAAWRRFRGGSVRWLAIAAVAAAAVVSFNLYGATALAITFPLLAWACFLERRDWRVFRDSALIGALAWGLTACWLTPSFLLVNGRNLRMVSPPGNAWSRPVAAGIIVLFVLASLGIGRLGRYSAYSFFIWSGLWFLSVYILGYRWFGLQLYGDSHRLLPELDLFVILCAVELLGLLWAWKPQGRLWPVPRAAVVILLVLCFRPSWRYLKHAYTEFPEDTHWQQRLEYRTPVWFEEHFPGQRVFVNGTVRFWYNVWQDGMQADGGSQQGLLNPLIPTAQWRIVHSDDPELTRNWLQALSVDILFVPGPISQEPYKDYVYPKMYDANLPLLHDDGEGNRYYRIPRRATGIVRVVDGTRLGALPAVPRDGEKPALMSYVETIEAVPPGGAAPERARARWLNSDALDVETEVQDGEALLVEETWDPYWRAYVDGRRQTITPDPVGFMTVHVPPGKHLVHMMFETPREVIVGRFLTAASLLLAGFLVMSGSATRNRSPVG